MDPQTGELAALLGARVKHERKARHWTLDQLATASGVSRRMLVKVEQGAANPSVGTLLRISDSLGMELPALVQQAQPSRTRVTRAGEGAALWCSDGGGRGVLVAGTEPPDVVELWDWTLAPGDRHQSEPHARGTKELLHVARGVVTVEIADQSVTLAAGDALAFPGDTVHSYRNRRARPARFSLAVFEPGVGDGPRDGHARG